MMLCVDVICRKIVAVTPGFSAMCQLGEEKSSVAPVPFLSMPTDCSAGPETATMRADSWEEPGCVRERPVMKVIWKRRRRCRG